MIGRNRRRGGPRRRRNPGAPRKEYPLCPTCNRPVRDLASAITHRETDRPAHFDCILKILRAQSELRPNEKICYLGNGDFGILQFRHNHGPVRFLIRKRIPYEQTDPMPEWRKSFKKALPFR